MRMTYIMRNPRSREIWHTCVEKAKIYKNVWELLEEEEEGGGGEEHVLWFNFA